MPEGMIFRDVITSCNFQASILYLVFLKVRLAMFIPNCSPPKLFDSSSAFVLNHPFTTYNLVKFNYRYGIITEHH